MNNYIHYKHEEVRDDIIYPFPNFNGAIWEWINNFIPPFLGM